MLLNSRATDPISCRCGMLQNAAAWGLAMSINEGFQLANAMSLHRIKDQYNHVPRVPWHISYAHPHTLVATVGAGERRQKIAQR